jgi:S-DNA-T family DNA segregation ATPase FtsK/SpoIIIE
MLFAPVGAAKPLRVQGALVTEREIDAIVSYLKEHSPTASSPAPELGDLTSDEFSRTAADDDEDPLFLAALRTVVESRQASTSMLQRRLRIGYARAARLIDALEARGAIGPADGAKPREVYWTVQQFQEQYPQDRSTS